MSYITLLITIPLTIFAVLFAVSNTADVAVGLWPLANTYTISSGVFGLLLLGGGFFLGALFVWIHSQKIRFKYWRESRRAARLEKELAGVARQPSEAKPVTPPAGEKNLAALVLPPATK